MGGRARRPGSPPRPGKYSYSVARPIPAVRADAAHEESLRRIQDLLTARLQKFGRRERLTVTWRRPAAGVGQDGDG